MESKIWLKPAEGAKLDKLKAMSEKSGDAVLLECLFLDTADADLLSNNIVLVLCAGPNGLSQMAVLEDPADCAAREAVSALPQNGFEPSQFPQEISQKISAVMQDKRLQLQFAAAFEQKTRLVSEGEGAQYQLVHMLGRFEDDDLKGELRALELKSMGKPAQPLDVYAARLAREASLERCGSPWFEALRVKASGFQPVNPEKKLKKYADMGAMQPPAAQLFALMKAYIALSAYSFERTAVHKLRVEARKMMATVDAYEAYFGDKTARYLEDLQRLIDDTDEARHADLLDEEVGLIYALNPQIDFSSLQQKLTEKRAAFRDSIREAYMQGKFSDGIVAMWTDIHVKAAAEASGDNRSTQEALEKVKAWIAELNTFKKSGMSDPEKVHAYRVLVRKVRYALENMDAMIPRRALKAAEGLKKIQDELGMLCDVSQHMTLLHSLAAESGDADFAYRCGVCAGIFSGCQQEIYREAVEVWKDYRGDIRMLEELL